MNHDKFECTFNMPVALSGENEFGLPPYAPQEAYLVDDYEDSLNSWMQSDEKVSSYFVGVKSNHGMWLDFNNNYNLDKEVAILISVQGVNPITGLPQKEPLLEQYNDMCPKHNIPFGKDRYCSECGYKWPKQNYLSTCGTPRGRLWLDGFRSIDGLVRQYIFTEEVARGVAANIIGEKRVFAIGITFFESKKKKEVRLGGFNNRDYLDFNSSEATLGYKAPQSSISFSSLTTPRGNFKSDTNSYSASGSSVLRSRGIAKNSFQEDSQIEIGAGAKIKQSVYECPEDLDFWVDKPSGMICINYCPSSLVAKIISKGDKYKKDGFMENIPVGN